MNQIKFVLLSLLTLGFVACATNANKAKVLDTEITHKEQASNTVTIGIKEDEMVAQQEVKASELLRDTQLAAYKAEGEVYGGERYLENRGQYGVLQDCYVELSKYTGDIKPMPEERNYVIPEEGYELGLDKKEKNLIGVKREYLKERIEKFRDYKSTLIKRSTEYDKRIKMCETALYKEQQKRVPASADEE